MDERNDEDDGKKHIAESSGIAELITIESHIENPNDRGQGCSRRSGTGESKDFCDPGCDRVNPHGSGISLGHPVGCTGARILVTLLHEMERRDAHKGLATLCIGGGQGMAMIIER